MRWTTSPKELEFFCQTYRDRRIREFESRNVLAYVDVSIHTLRKYHECHKDRTSRFFSRAHCSTSRCLVNPISHFSCPPSACGACPHQAANTRLLPLKRPVFFFFLDIFVTVVLLASALLLRLLSVLRAGPAPDRQSIHPCAIAATMFQPFHPKSTNTSSIHLSSPCAWLT